MGVVVGLAAGGQPHSAEALGFRIGLAGPDAGVDVVGAATFGQQVQRQGSKLQRGATGQEQHLVLGRDVQQLAQVSLGLGLDAHVVLATVAHLHHRHAGAMPVGHFGGGLGQHGLGQHGRTGTEVEELAHGKTPAGRKTKRDVERAHPDMGGP